jgi:hypothetical protein
MAKRGRKKKNKEDVDMKKMADAMHETQEIREGFPVYQDKGRPVINISLHMKEFYQVKIQKLPNRRRRYAL